MAITMISPELSFEAPSIDGAAYIISWVNVDFHENNKYIQKMFIWWLFLSKEKNEYVFS